MTNLTVSRRDFLKMSGATVGALVVGQMLPISLAKAAQEAGLLDENLTGYISSMCEMCVWRCGLVAKIVEGRVVKLDGNPDHPHSRGKLCPRGQSGLMNTYDPDRVLTPLIRVGKRGEGKFRPASWDEALDLVASKMQGIKEQYGPEAMIFSSTHNLSQLQFENLLNAYGSPNYGTQRSLCFNAMIVGNLMTYGMEEPARDYSEVEYIILTGRNLVEAVSTSETGDLISAMDRGAKMVYLDPRFTKTAAKADLWLPIKPGTDLAFHLALLHVIIKEKLYDHAFVAANTVGFEELETTVAPYTPAWAAEITELKATDIETVAREFAAAGSKALAHNGWRTSNFENSFQTARAIASLNALVGNWGTTMLSASGGHGGEGLGMPPQPPYPRVSARRLDGVPWKYPLVPFKLGVFQEMRDAILTGDPYQARGWFISRQNPVQSLPDRTRTLEAMGKMDFIVSVDISLNDTSWFADVVLPESSYLERYDPLHQIGDRVFIRQPVIEPQGDAKSALWIYKHLGERLGLGDYFQYEDEEDFIRQQLEPTGVSLEEIRKKGYLDLNVPESEEEVEELHWNTASGKVELFSNVLDGAGFDGCADWEEPPMPENGRFYLLTGKVAQHTQFATQNNQLLNKYQDEPRLWINTKSAERLLLKDFDLVRVTSDVGEVNIMVNVTEAIRPDCVYMTPGFGHISKGLTTGYGVGASDSVLHVTYTDPISGGQALSQTFVTVQGI